MEARKHWFSTFRGVEAGMGWVRRGEVKQKIRFWRQKQGQVMMGSQPFGGLWGHEKEGDVRMVCGSPWCGGGLGWGILSAGGGPQGLWQCLRRETAATHLGEAAVAEGMEGRNGRAGLGDRWMQEGEGPGRVMGTPSFWLGPLDGRW